MPKSKNVSVHQMGNGNMVILSTENVKKKSVPSFETVAKHTNLTVSEITLTK